MKEADMAEGDTRATLADWLRSKGYAEEEIQKILVKLAEYDHQTLSDAVFDSIGGDGKTLDQIVREALKEAS
jgi:hypothetical protein